MKEVTTRAYLGEEIKEARHWIEIFNTRSEIKERQHKVRKHKAMLNGELSRKQYCNMVVVGHSSYNHKGERMFDISELTPRQRLLSFNFNSDQRSLRVRNPPVLGDCWLVDLDDPMTLHTGKLEGRAVLWELMLRASSNAANNLMLVERPVRGHMVGRTDYYRNRTLHFYEPHTFEAVAFAERDMGPMRSWALYIPSEATGATGLVIVRKPGLVNIEKCLADYAAATLAGLKMDDVRRRLGE